MTAVKFISHDENDVLLWMTADPPAGPFDTTMKMWNACIDKLERQGYVERIGESATEVTVTPAGEDHALGLRLLDDAAEGLAREAAEKAGWTCGDCPHERCGSCPCVCASSEHAKPCSQEALRP